MKGAFGQLTVIPLGAKQHDRTDGKVLVVPDWEGPRSSFYPSPSLTLFDDE